MDKHIKQTYFNNAISYFYRAPIPVPTAVVVPSFHKTKSAPVTAMTNINHQVQFAPLNGTTTATAGSAALRPMKRRPPTATLPCVDAIERHELMLLRMGGNAKRLDGREYCERLKIFYIILNIFF
jgi:hypothetical protein